jgi:ribose-phosphate pyrophosphokinase
MITVIAASGRLVITPTMFPDGTSQVWKLPNELLRAHCIDVDWRFESEREVIDLLSLCKLVPNQLNVLHIPYLPYGRQDKEVSNTSTFNLEVFADLINSTHFPRVTSIDVHNPGRTEDLIDNLSNIKPYAFHHEVIGRYKPNFIVYPDAGAAERYNIDMPVMVCDKTRDQLTGQITGHKIVRADLPRGSSYVGQRFLIVDDLCDGGATFISVAKLLREEYPDAHVGLCVTHGIFSKGRDHLLTQGIDELYTTNSLPKNEREYNV